MEVSILYTIKYLQGHGFLIFRSVFHKELAIRDGGHKTWTLKNY